MTSIWKEPILTEDQMKYRLVALEEGFPVNALAKFVHRLGWPEIRALSTSNEEAEQFLELILNIRRTEAELRVKPLIVDIAYTFDGPLHSYEEVDWVRLKTLLSRVGWSTISRLCSSPGEQVDLMNAARLMFDALDYGLIHGELAYFESEA